MHTAPPETQDRGSCRPAPRRVRAACAHVRGLTLVELVVTLAVLATLVSMAAPSFRDTIQNVRLVGETNRWARTIRLARSEAIKRSGTVTVCARASEGTCGTDWSDGWVVFEDAAGAGTIGTRDAGEALIAEHAGAPEGTSRSAAGFVRPAGLASRARVSFDARGRPDWTAGTLVLCDARGASGARALILGGAGQLRSVEPPGGAAPPDAFGDPVSCA